MSNWISVNESLPKSEERVLTRFQVDNGNVVLMIGFYAHKFEVPHDPDDLKLDYDEEKDQHYLTEGWYEEIQNWDEFGFLRVEFGEVTHWKRIEL